MMTLVVQIDVERIQLSAAGLFKVGVHLIPAVSAVYELPHTASQISLSSVTIPECLIGIIR